MPKNNLINRCYCIYQSCLNKFILPCGRFCPKQGILHFPPPQDLGAAAPSNPQQTPLHTGCRPTQSGKARGPLRPISGPRRCYPRCHREYAHLRDLPRCGDPPIAKSTCWDNPPIVKTKNSASLQLFCDCELFPVPAKRKRDLHTANYLRFCAAIRDWGARNNCQSQKSCNSDRFFVSGLLE